MASSRIRVLLSTGSLHVMDTAQCFALAAETGFDGIEIMCDDRWSTRDPHYLAALSRRYGLPVLVAHTPFSRRLHGWKHADEVQRIRHTLSLAEALGAGAIVVHLPPKIGLLHVETNGRRLILPWRSPYGGVKRWIEHDLPEAQRQTPVKIAIENMPAHQVARRRIDLIWWNTVDEWSRIHDWLTLDTTHWATKGVNPLDAYRAANGRVCHVHLSNFDGHEHRLLHTGRVDLGSLLRALAADCYAGTISVELQPDVLEFTDDAKVRGHLAASLAFCRAHLDTE